MKKMIFLVALAVGLMVLAFNVQADDDVRVSYSKLPAKAKTFIETYFGANPKTREIERETWSGNFSVDLRNGYDVKFDSEGRLIEIDSPDHSNIAPKIIKGILPAKAVQYLQGENILDNVDDIKVLRDGSYLVDIDVRFGDREYRFDTSGNLLK